MNYLLLQAPAQTSNYMIAGYAVIFSVMLLYVISLIVRRRNLEQDVQVLETLGEAEPNP
jgi:CcmD family protein